MKKKLITLKALKGATDGRLSELQKNLSQVRDSRRKPLFTPEELEKSIIIQKQYDDFHRDDYGFQKVENR
jgi:hypothetical protein